MKKRFFAALLSFIMVFSLLPLNALAKLDTGHKIDVTFTVLYVGDEFRIGYNYGSSEKTQFVCQYSTPHSDTAYNNHTIAISDIKAAAGRASVNSGYQIVGWSKESNANPTMWSLNMSGTTACNKGTTIYLVAKNPNPTPAKPSKPSGEDIKNLLGEVTVDCINSSVDHADQTYPLLDGSFTVGDVQGSASPYTCTVTVKAPAYVAKYNGDTGATHTLSDAASKTITLKHDGTKWVAQTATPIVFKVVCDATPDDPKVGDNFDFNKDIVDVICETTNNHNASYGLKNGYYTVSDKKQLANGNWQCKITINLAKYFELYNSDSQHPGHTRDMEHSDAFAFMMIYPTWYADSGNWIFVGTGAAKIYVKCDATPTEPSKEDIKELLGSNAVQIICTNDESGHGSKTFGLIDDTFSIVHSGYNCEVKIDSFNEYVEEFNTELNVAQGTHFSDTSKADQSIINLKWVNGKWTVVNTPAEHYVLCVTPKYTVTYTDGVDGEEVFADQVYDNLLSGTTTPAFNGTPARTDYVFAGWEPEVAETVTGNATYVAQWKDDKNNNGIPDENEDRYTVTYTDGAANGASFTEQKHENLPSGTATPAWGGTANKPVWEDHVFAGWEPAVAPTVTGNATYVAQWKDDKNNNGTPDDEEEKYTVTYTDGVNNEEVFADQVYDNLLSGTTPPAFKGTPTRTGYTFTSWAWYKVEDGNDVKIAEPHTMPAYDLKAVAQWTADPIAVDLSQYVYKQYVQKYNRKDTTTFNFTAEVYPAAMISSASSPVAVFANSLIDTVKGEVKIDSSKNGEVKQVTFEKTDKLSAGRYYVYITENTENKGTNSYITYDNSGYVLNIRVFDNGKTGLDVELLGINKVGENGQMKTTDDTTVTFVNTYTRAYHPSTPSKPTLNTGDHYAYVMGYPDGTVRPNGSITRAEVSAILFRLLSDKTRDEYFTTESSFTDVKAGAWYNNSIATLEKAGVIVDTAKGGAFRPNEAITRAELAAMLAQFSDAKPVKGVKFSDVSAEHWAYEAIAIAAKMGWIEGYPDGTFRPDATITRAEMMTLVNRALERVPSDEDHLLSKRVMLTFPDCKSGDWFYIAVQEATNSHTYERAATEKNGDEQWTALRANRDWTLLEK